MIFVPWHRLTGLAFVAASGGTTLIHRAVYEASRNGPPLVIEMGLCLATMMLASRPCRARRPGSLPCIQCLWRGNGIDVELPPAEFASAG